MRKSRTAVLFPSNWIFITKWRKGPSIFSHVSLLVLFSPFDILSFLFWASSCKMSLQTLKCILLFKCLYFPLASPILSHMIIEIDSKSRTTEHYETEHVWINLSKIPSYVKQGWCLQELKFHLCLKLPLSTCMPFVNCFVKNPWDSWSNRLFFRLKHANLIQLNDWRVSHKKPSWPSSHLNVRTNNVVDGAVCWMNFGFTAKFNIIRYYPTALQATTGC